MSQGTRAKKVRNDKLASGKDRVKARPLINAAIYLAEKYLAGK